MASLNDILNWFKKGLVPTEEQFRQAWSSFRHKDAQVPISDVEDLTNQLNNKLGLNHTSDATAHTAVLLKKDGSNLNDADKAALKTVLGVGEIPNNVALVDMGEPTDVFNKDQIRALYMSMADYIVGGKIRADKIEALGLTTLIEVSQTSLASFAANSANYVFEQNDIIAIPDATGNFALFIFKGGTKTVTSNYLPTGLTNITIAMVEGLQTALDGKVQKPTGTGVFIASQSGTTTTWVQVNPASYYLTFWNGSSFQPSVLYQNGTKLGIGTQTPSEMLHLNDGRVRAKAYVFDVNSETLPNQIVTDGTRFSGTSSGGTKRGLMYNDYADLLALSNGMTDAQKTEWKTAMNGGWTTNTMSVAIITPPVAAKQDIAQWFIMRGANLNLNPASFAVYLVDSNNVEYQVPNSQVQLYTNGLNLAFWYNFKDLALGIYKIKLWNGVASYTTGASVTITLLSSVTPIDFSGITWTKTSETIAEVDNTITANGTSVSHSPNQNNYPWTNFEKVVCAAKSSTFVGTDENFYIKANVAVGSGRLQYWGNMIGVGLSSNALSMINSSQAFVRIRQNNDTSSIKYGWSDSGSSTIAGGANIPTFQTVNFEVVIMRNNGIYTIIISTGSTSLTFVKSGSNEALSLLYYGFSASNNDGITLPTACQSSVSFIEGYKF